MKISGFSMIKNASKLYYPIKESIMSILPIVDEFIVAVGDCDEDDNTRKLIESINSNKIKIIDTIWDLKKYPNGMEHAHQTDIAKKACSGDWVFYLQADEVIHEKYHNEIVSKCKQYLDEEEVEGFLFKYKHFWGDYNHYHISHRWYPKEIRIVRNKPETHSWESAQSFRKIENFDGINYRQQEETYKLNVIELDAYVYHYGWVRPPKYMQKKKKVFATIHRGEKQAEEEYKRASEEFDFGPLDRLAIFDETHPKVMKEWISKFDWEDKLQYEGKPDRSRKKHKHEKLKYRLLTFIEQTFLNGNHLGGFRNYKLLKK